MKNIVSFFLLLGFCFVIPRGVFAQSCSGTAYSTSYGSSCQIYYPGGYSYCADNGGHQVSETCQWEYGVGSPCITCLIPGACYGYHCISGSCQLGSCHDVGDCVTNGNACSSCTKTDGGWSGWSGWSGGGGVVWWGRCGGAARPATLTCSPLGSCHRCGGVWG